MSSVIPKTAFGMVFGLGKYLKIPRHVQPAGDVHPLATDLSLCNEWVDVVNVLTRGNCFPMDLLYLAHVLPR